MRKDDPADRRAKGLWLTEQGATLAARMENVLDDLRGHILQNVDKADLEAAIRVLQAFDNSEMPQPGTLEKQVEAAS
jgi:MarR family transcriptional regulator for hemolysin